MSVDFTLVGVGADEDAQVLLEVEGDDFGIVDGEERFVVVCQGLLGAGEAIVEDGDVET